jgi:hypothetical protein
MTLGSDCELRSRRAAKQHECFLHENAFTLVEPSADCTGIIEPGDLYIENMDGAAAYQSGTRYCVPCAVEQFGIDPGLIGDERGEVPEAGEMSTSDGLGGGPPRRQGEVYAETDPDHWPDGRPTYGCGR